MHAGKSVLVVEDDVEIREALDDILRAEGYDVLTCGNGLEALQRLRGGAHADVILLDLMMPVMDGWQFRVQQRRDPELAGLPVIAISADGTSKAAAIDADAYIRKPVDYDSLIETIDRTLLTLERKQLQAKLAEADRLTSLGTLAAGMAHEINNPLAYAMANMAYAADMLPALIARAGGTAAEREADEQLLAAVREAHEGCERIRAIVRDLQLFSRPQEEDRSPVDLRRVLDSSANIVKNEIFARARLTREYGEIPKVMGNRARLGQVFLNLILNAAQAIPEHATSGLIRITTSTGPDGEAIVEVADNGHGIRPEVMGRIFDPFFTTKPVGVGTGLGLSISHSIVAALGGKLTVQSEVGQGTTFRVALPGVEGEKSDPPRPHRGPSARARVLVIDDEEMICTTLQRVLSPMHAVETTTSAEGALASLVGGATYDVILCDLMMPTLSGMDLFEELEKVRPEQARRIVFLSGGTFTARAQSFAARMPDRFIDKPFDVDKLLSVIDARIEAARAST
jgi:signal transduction histidine kinase